MPYTRALIVLSVVLASCGSYGTTQRYTVDLTSEDGDLAFEIHMNGCYVFNAFIRNRSSRDRGALGTTLAVKSPEDEILGTVNIVFPATRAGAKSRAGSITGNTGILKKARDSHAGLKPKCGDVRYSLQYF